METLNIEEVTVHLFWNEEKKSKEEYLDKVLEELPKYESIGYGGYKEKEALKKHLSWAMGGTEEIPLLKESEEVREVIRGVINKCLKALPPREKIYLFLFPTANEFVITKMQGVNGFSTWKQTILCYLNIDTPGWKKALERTIAHEYFHTQQERYYAKKTVREQLLHEGTAEQFVMTLLNEKTSPLIDSITEEKAMELVEALGTKLDEENEALFKELCYGGKKFPLWAGYAMGYYLVKRTKKAI